MLALALALAEEQEEEVNEGIAAWKESEGERRRATTRRQRWTIKGAWELGVLSPIVEQRRSRRRRRSRRCCCFKLFVALSLSLSSRLAALPVVAAAALLAPLRTRRSRETETLARTFRLLLFARRARTRLSCACLAPRSCFAAARCLLGHAAARSLWS